MDMTQALDGHPVTRREARHELHNHGVPTAMGPSGELLALADYGPDGTEWVALPLDSAAILEWLGY